jgi:hypothetical protein
VNLAASAASTSYKCGVNVNGGTTQWGDDVNKVSDSTGGGAGVVKRLRLSANDTVQLFASQGSGGAVAFNANAANRTRLVVVWEGS